MNKLFAVALAVLLVGSFCQPNLFFGEENQATSGAGNVAWGKGNKFSGDSNVANGDWNKFDGSENKVKGDQNTISGDQNDIEGSQNEVSGGNNWVSGSGNSVSGGNNFVMGTGNSVMTNLSSQQEQLKQMIMKNVQLQIQARLQGKF